MLTYTPLQSLPKVIIMSTKTHKLLLLCTGNTCRSQMAHAMSQQWCQSNGLSFEIESRGIRAKPGDPTTVEVLMVLSQANINWQGTSEQLSIADLKWADDVWGMTQEHLDYAEQLGSELNLGSQPRYQLLAGTHELVDPLNCGLAAYEQLFFALQKLLPNRLGAI